MSLRSYHILKYLITLIFVFELLAPTIMATPQQEQTEKNTQTRVSLHEGTIDYLELFLFEESNSEEREGKDLDIEFLFVADIFSDLAKFQDNTSYRIIEQVRCDSQPSLYARNRVLRI